MNQYNADQRAGMPVANATGNTGVTGNNAGGHLASLAAHPSTGPAPNTAGPHRHDWANKLDPRVDSDLSGAQMTANIGPHGTRMPVDPSVVGTGVGHHVGGAGVGAGVGSGMGPNAGVGAHHHHDNHGGGAALGGAATGAAVAAGAHHHHHHDHHAGGAGLGGAAAGAAVGEGIYHHNQHHHAGGPGMAGPAAVGGGTYAAEQGQGNNYTTTGANNGPHKSRIANALDPRVPSGSHNASTGGYAQDGAMGGPYAGMGPGGALPGPAPNTAGPHRSDMLNRADPAVQSQGGAPGRFV